MPGVRATPDIRAGFRSRGASPRRKPIFLPPARRSGKLVIRIAPRDVGLFRFLLEARDNLALFTVLDSRAALLKLLFSPHQERDVRGALAEMAETVPFAVEEWPFTTPPECEPSAPPCW